MRCVKLVDFGKRLRALRISKGWTQSQLSARLGVTKSVISAYETALRYPSYDILIRIAALFGVSSDYLLGIEAAQTLDVTGLSDEHVELVRKLIDDAFRSTFITPGMVTCLDCAMMQEIAEYPLMLLSLLLWHAQYTGDLAYLASHYDAACALLDVYRRDYERDGLLSHLDKWCVVEWPKNFQDGYAIDIREGKVCEPAHVSLNAYYIEAIRCANAMAALLGRSPYRDAGPLIDAFYAAFYMAETHTFRDGVGTDHSSYIANTMAYAYDLIPDESFRANYLALFDRRGAAELSLFCTFPILWHFRRSGDETRIRASLKNPGAWLRMLSEGATTTYEGWGRDTKWNTSLFHLTMSYAAIFLCD